MEAERMVYDFSGQNKAMNFDLPSEFKRFKWSGSAGLLNRLNSKTWSPW
jgi:hypothetical protein